MDYINDYSDERQKSWCIQCGVWIGGVDTNKDHVPSKVLLRRPFPQNLPVVQTCKTCNSGFSLDEEYLSIFLNCVLLGSTDPKQHKDIKAARALQRHEKLRASIEQSKSECKGIEGDKRFVWKPDLDRVKRVVIKNGRGHVLYEFGEPMLTEPEHVWFRPLETMSVEERREFENKGSNGDLAPWPEVGSRMMTRVVTGQDLCNGWVIVQEGVYRYAIEQCGVMLVRSVLYEYLATEVYWSDY